MKIECGILVALLVVCVIVEARRPRCTELTCPGLEQVCKMTRPDNCPRSINKGKRCRRKPTCVTDHFTIGPVVVTVVTAVIPPPVTVMPSNSPECPGNPIFCLSEDYVARYPECTTDADCDAAYKCCGTPNKKHCRMPFLDKDGTCPRRLNGRVTCDPRPRKCPQDCYHDGECPDVQKCCFNGCENHCDDSNP